VIFGFLFKNNQFWFNSIRNWQQIPLPPKVPSNEGKIYQYNPGLDNNKSKDLKKYQGKNGKLKRLFEIDLGFNKITILSPHKNPNFFFLNT